MNSDDKKPDANLKLEFNADGDPITIGGKDVEDRRKSHIGNDPNRKVKFIRLKKGDDGRLEPEDAEGSSARPEFMSRVQAMREGKLALTRAEFEDFSQMSAPAQAAYSVKKLREQAKELKRIDASLAKQYRKRTKAERKAAKRLH